MEPRQVLLCFCIFISLVYKSSCICNKIPEGVVKTRNRIDVGKYILEIPGNPKNYTPLQRYNIYLKINPRSLSRKTFKNFIIRLESDENENDDYGVGQLGYDNGTEALATMSAQCPNTVVETNTLPKNEVQVYWTAPPSGSGCVSIKATVVESMENWFSEDGPLTRRLCEETLQNENIQPDIVRKCCACDEAKYEMAFEGKWTRNTHPRHFPIDQWNTKFSDVIGASHQLYHAFWRYEDLASEGLRELAETGVTRTLEGELKNSSEHIRTIIKARGLQYPNITKSTYAVFRVDNRNHLVSIVAKIMPSPDWIVGVSNLELCTEDCTWEASRTLNLYPWDIGTNDGITYESSIPAQYQQPIRRLTPNNPNSRESPFYSEEGEEMKPIAKLHLTRQRLYTKACTVNNAEDIDCATTDWSEWTECSATCGEGKIFRRRSYMDPNTSDQCQATLVEYKDCNLEECPVSGDEDHKTDDGLDEDSPSDKETSDVICGDENKNCEEDSNCPGTFWGPWSSCTLLGASCGKGTKTRIRIKKQGDDDDNEDQGQNCPPSEDAECEIPCESPFSGLGSSSIIISQGPVGKVTDCKVSRWSHWSKCYLLHSNTCGEGYMYKTRKILRHQSNGGNECPKRLEKKKPCTIPCPAIEDLQECIMSKWSNWTPCSSNCGASAVQIRTRQILYQPPNVKRCPVREEKKPCHLPVACTEDGQPILNR